MTLCATDYDGVELLTLDYPPLNTLNFESVCELGAYFRAFKSDRPLVVTGRGKAFSAGVDTTAFASYSARQRKDMFIEITKMVRAFCSIEAPVVAGINGHALGGGLVLALCTDYRVVAVGNHKFGLTEAKAGVPFPAGPLEVIRREIPGPLLRSLALTSRIISGDDLVTQLVFDESVAADCLIDVAVLRATEMMQQSSFNEVKKQIRGALL